MAEPKYMDLEEFVQHGYLQEANRQFFHPLGLALEVHAVDRGDSGVAGELWIWDCRDDPEGIVVGTDQEAVMWATPIRVEMRDLVASVLETHRAAREALFGSVIQPIVGEVPEG